MEGDVSFAGRSAGLPSPPMTKIKRILGGVVAALAALFHLWYRGVLAAPEVKRRKAARRGARRA
jgi:phage-related minor tail protein